MKASGTALALAVLLAGCASKNSNSPAYFDSFTIKPFPKESCQKVRKSQDEKKPVDDSEVYPIVRAEPRYPDKAIRNGIQGCVKLSFDLLADGSTANIKVTDSYPENVFDQVSINAVTAWKYPRSANELRKKTIVLDYKLEGG